MNDREMPAPGRRVDIRRWKTLYEFASVFARDPLLTDALITFSDGFHLIYSDGEMRISASFQRGDLLRQENVDLALDQVAGYIAALEGDVLQAQAEIEALERDAGQS